MAWPRHPARPPTRRAIVRQWSATFDVEADQKEAIEKTLTQGVYRTGFEALKRHFGD